MDAMADDAESPRRGRPPGVPNKITAAAKEMIMERGRPLELLCDVARGLKIRVGPPAGPGKPQYAYPDLGQRIAASATLLKKVIPDIKAAEITGPGGEPLALPATNTSRMEIAKAVIAVLSSGTASARVADAAGLVAGKVQGSSVSEGGHPQIAARADGEEQPPHEKNQNEPPTPAIGETFNVDRSGRVQVRLADRSADGVECWEIIRSASGFVVDSFGSRAEAEAAAIRLIGQGAI